MKIILATHNKHKLEEMQAILKLLDVEIKTLSAYPGIGDIPETGKTLKENALIKARIVHKKTGLPAIADDTGLEVAALAGAPGVFSARFAGENVSYEDNVNKLLLELRAVKKEDRSAQFRTVTAFVDGSKEIITEGKIEGRIINTPRGINGFGYDPVFYIPEMNRTFAELFTDEKNKISHRGIALQKLVKLLYVHWDTK